MALIYLVIMLLLGGGMFAMWKARKYRTLNCPPVPSWNPKYWRPIWMTRSWFTPTGYKLQLIGTIMVVTGALLALLASFVTH